MSDLGGDERRRGLRKIPFTKRRKNSIIENPASLNHLSNDALEKLMCTLDIKTLFTIAALNKRVNAIFRHPLFFKRCIAPYISAGQRIAALVNGHAITLNHDTEGHEEFYQMHAVGETMDGVKYDVEWSIDVHGYADSMNDNYEAEDFGGDVPEDDDERRQWFREHFDGHVDYVQGTAVFDFPTELKEVKFVHERVRDIISYFTRKFIDYLLLENVTMANSGDDQWYIEVVVRPFDVRVTVYRPKGKMVAEVVYNELEREHRSKPAEEIQSSKMEEEPSEYLMTHISHVSKELARTLEQVQMAPRETDDRRLEERCKAAVNEARELLQRVQSGAYDEETLDKLNRVNSRLLECIEL